MLTHDVRALNHILTHSAEYQKPAFARRTLAAVLGEGVPHWLKRSSRTIELTSQKGVLFTEGAQTVQFSGVCRGY